MTVRTMNAEATSVQRPGFGRLRGRGLFSAEKTRGALTALNLHFVGIGLLALLNIYLLIHMAYLWQSAHSQNADALAQQRVQLKTAEIASLPLQGLDGKLARSTDEADGFYNRRFPYAFSQVLAELGDLAKKQNAKMTRVQYGYSPIDLGGAATDSTSPSLIEVRIDASLTGEYRSLVQLINNLERDRTFFLISGVTLTGQQSGTVSLRLKLTTYLRPARGDEKPEPLPAATEGDDDAGKDTPAGGPAQ